jgi:hypothetical protein
VPMPETGDLRMLRGDDRAGVDVVVKIALGLSAPRRCPSGSGRWRYPALVRDISQAPDGVTAIRADLASDDVTAVADAVQRSDVIISCLGASSKSDIALGSVGALPAGKPMSQSAA